MSKLPHPQRLKERSIANTLFRMDVRIYYGSQTGNTQELAERIFFYLSSHAVKTSLAPIVEADFNDDTVGLFVLCISTTGVGDPPADSKSFWRMIMKKDFLIRQIPKVKAIVFAMGDSR